MDNDTASTIQNIGSKITAGADDLFSNKSKWVHTWVSKQGLPFLGLIAFLICYYKIGVGDIRLPFNSIVWIAIVLILFVAIRSAGATKNKRFNEITKSYRLSMLYIAVLMLSGNSQSDHSLFYWSILVIGFWFATWIYREKLLVPGEYPAISLLLAGIVDGANPPFDAWLFITFCFGPAIALLYWQMRSLKPVLFLIGIVVLFWITADISGPFIILGLIACALFLWVAVQAISKLARDDVSNLVYSFGLLLVSALVFFLFVGLLRLEAGTAITWWVMLVSFSVVGGFIYKRAGDSIVPMLVLWLSFWICVTLITTWGSFFYDFSEIIVYGNALILLCIALALRYFAVRFDSHRLLVWTRLYMIVNVFNVYFFNLYAMDETESSGIALLILMIVLFGFGIWLSSPKQLHKGLPWWRGIVNPRNIVAIRRVARRGTGWIVSIPFVGPTAAVIVKAIGVITHLKKDGKPINSGDVLIITLSVGVAASFSLWFASNYFIGDLEATIHISDKQAQGVIAALVTGLLLSSVGAIKKEPLFPLLGMISFVIAPLILSRDNFLDLPIFWLVLIATAICIMSTRDFVSQALRLS